MSKSEEDVLRLEEDKERSVLPKERNFGKKKKGMALKDTVCVSSFVK